MYYHKSFKKLDFSQCICNTITKRIAIVVFILSIIPMHYSANLVQRRQSMGQESTPSPSTPIEESNQETASMMIEEIVEFGKFSYELEEKREQSLIGQSGQMLTAFSVFSAVVLMSVPIAIDNLAVPTSMILGYSGVLFALLSSSLLLTIFAQWRFKYKTLIDVGEFYNKVNEDFLNYRKKSQFKIQWKEQLTEIQLSKKQTNNKRVKLLMISMVLFIASVLTLIAAIIHIAIL